MSWPKLKFFYLFTMIGFLSFCSCQSQNANPEIEITMTTAPSPTLTPTPTVTPTPTPVVASLTFSFAGDVTLGSDAINQNSTYNFYSIYNQVQDDAYFFANVLPYFSTDDLTLVNLDSVCSAFVGGNSRCGQYHAASHN